MEGGEGMLGVESSENWKERKLSLDKGISRQKIEGRGKETTVLEDHTKSERRSPQD